MAAPEVVVELPFPDRIHPNRPLAVVAHVMLKLLVKILSPLALPSARKTSPNLRPAALLAADPVPAASGLHRPLPWMHDVEIRRLVLVPSRAVTWSASRRAFRRGPGPARPFSFFKHFPR